MAISHDDAGNTGEALDILGKDGFTELANSAKTETNALPYRPASTKCNPIGTLVPTKLYYEIQYALSVFTERGIDTTDYVREKLNYTSNIAVCKAFAAEQVDAIALAIYQIENKKLGFILADNTGTGKGRVCAGLLRYAYNKGKIPVFMTKTTSLYNSLYRDLIAIGGFDKRGKLPVPFILNGLGGKSEGEDGSIYYDSDIIIDEKVVFRSEPKKAILEQLQKSGVPNKADIVLSTYSVLNSDRFAEDTSGKNVKVVLDFFGKYKDRLLLVLDESHLASGSGNINDNLTSVKKTLCDLLFSSATFAKRYDNLKFYVDRTAISSAGVREEKVQEFVDAFKDNALEFIAQGVAESGGMIRREKTLEGCDVSYAYQMDKKSSQYRQYDTLMDILRQIIAFTRTPDYKKALELALVKAAKDNKLELPNTPKPSSGSEKKEWLEENTGKYSVQHYLQSSVKNRNSWIENLLFSLKADYVAEQAISIMKNRVSYTNNYSDGRSENVSTNKKPLIAVRNTGQSSLDLLDKEVGQPLTERESDFSYTLVKILEQCMRGRAIFTEIDPEADAKDKEKVSVDIVILNEYFLDGGAKYNELLTRIASTQTGLPISPLDYIISKIQEATRADWDYTYTKNHHFIVEDTTQRSLRLMKDSDGRWLYSPKPKQNDTLKIARFNNGVSDAVIINVAASTGESFHSSTEYRDTRKRCMLIHQVELDVNIEMQKLGRVNRTGQLNFPDYLYVVSMIPSEIRRLMALSRKLRSLSANTTGNMNQAKGYSEIKDGNGRPLEDIFTKYGYEVLETFLQENWQYKQYLPDTDAWYNKLCSPEEKLNIYCREIEIADCANQEFFYDQLNRLYADMRIEKVKNGEWDLDSSIINYKASEKNKAILFNDTGENAFKAPVYIQDVYVTSQSKPYSKEDVLSAEDRYAKGKKHNQFHQDFLSDLEIYRAGYESDRLLGISYYDTEFDEKGHKLSDKDKKIAEDLNTELRVDTIDKVSDMFDWMIRAVKYFTIGKPCIVPFDETVITKAALEYESDKITFDEYENNISSAGNVLSKFIGYKIDGKDGVLNPSNITFIFAMLNGEGAEYRVKPTRKNKCIIEDFIMHKSSSMSIIDLGEVGDWMVQIKPRVLVKTLTGNLLRAYDLYKGIKKEGDSIRIGSYTTIDGGIEKGIIIKSLIHEEMGEDTETFVPINSEQVMDDYDSTFILSDGRSRKSVDELHIFFKGDPKSKLNSIYADRIGELKEIASKTGAWSFLLADQLEYVYNNGVPQKKRSNVDVFSVKFTKTIADFFFNFSKEVVLVGTKTLEHGKKDAFLEKPEAGAEAAKAGVFEYTPLVYWDESKKPPHFVKFDKDTKHLNGVVTTEYELSPAEAISYALLPINVDIELAYGRLITRLKSQRNLENFVSFVKENKDSYLDIYNEASKMSITLLKYIFGNENKLEVGRVIAEKVTNEKLPELPKEYEQEGTHEELVEIPLTMDSAQDFLIKFLN